MFAGKVVGRVVATKKEASLLGDRLLIVQPTDWLGKPDGEPLIAIDTVSAGAGEFVFFVKSRDAAVAHPRVPPVDAAIVGIIDDVELEAL